MRYNGVVNQTEGKDNDQLRQQAQQQAAELQQAGRVQQVGACVWRVHVGSCGGYRVVENPAALRPWHLVTGSAQNGRSFFVRNVFLIVNDYLFFVTWIESAIVNNWNLQSPTAGRNNR